MLVLSYSSCDHLSIQNDTTKKPRAATVHHKHKFTTRPGNYSLKVAWNASDDQSDDFNYTKHVECCMMCRKKQAT